MTDRQNPDVEGGHKARVTQDRQAGRQAGRHSQHTHARLGQIHNSRSHRRRDLALESRNRKGPRG